MSGLDRGNDDWIPLQIKVFTRWFNSQLLEIKENEINSIINDLFNGVSLVQVVQYLTKKNTPRPWKKNPIRNIDMVQNCDLAIEMLQKDGINIIGISGKDINDKNEKLILGLIWSLILNYSINKSVQTPSNKSNKNALLQWAIERTSNYPNITKFEPYQIAMCALLDSYVPEMINYKNINPNDVQKNVQLGNDVMKELEIPVYIYPEDIMKNGGKVDDKTLLTQLAAAKVVLDNYKPKPKELPKNQNEKNSIFSPDDPSGDDIFSYVKKQNPDSLYFACIGTMGKSIMKGDKTNHWEATQNTDGNCEFSIGFNHHSIKLKSIRIHTGSNDFPQKAPDSFYLFGYNSHNQNWDVIYAYEGNRLKTMEIYDFEIWKDYQNIPYRVFHFCSTKPFALAYLKYYGELIDEKDEQPMDVLKKQSIAVRKNVPFNCPQQQGKYSDGIFKSAMKIYGPQLSYFLSARANDIDDSSLIFDIWNARDGIFKTEKYDEPAFLNLNFVHHEIFISGYHICGTKNEMNSWCVVGCQNNDDSGIILDHQENFVFENDTSYYNFKCNNDNPNKSFRIIRFIGLNGFISFHCLDIFGKAQPANSLTEDEYDGSYSYSTKIDAMFRGNA